MTTARQARRPFELRGIHVLWIMLAFFGWIIAVNVAFSIVAVRTFPGEDERHSYLQGLHYNQILAQHERERALGWRTALGLHENSAGDVTVHLDVMDRDDHALSALAVSGVLRRPATSRDDRPLTFLPDPAGGYAATVGAIPEGEWIFHGVAGSGDQKIDVVRRLTWRRQATR